MRRHKRGGGVSSRFEEMRDSLTGYWYVLLSLGALLLLLSLSALEGLWSRISGKPMKDFDQWE